MKEKKRLLVGLAWVSPGPSLFYKMYKLFADDAGSLYLESVPREKLPLAWKWIKAVSRWPVEGCWHNEYPGLVWSRPAGSPPLGATGYKVDWHLVRSTFAVAARVGDIETGEIVENEAVRYDPFLFGEKKRAAHNDIDKRHPHIRSVRSRGDFARLRRKYNVQPGWALDYLPESVILEQWGRKEGYRRMPQLVKV